MYRILGLVLIAAMLLGGCATGQQANALTTTLNAYASAVRWGDLAVAEQFVEPSERTAHPLSALDKARFKQLRVSEYDGGQGPMPDGKNQVRQVVHIGLINVHTQAERSIVDRQTWRYDEVGRHWWLTSGLPDVAER